MVGWLTVCPFAEWLGWQVPSLLAPWRRLFSIFFPSTFIIKALFVMPGLPVCQQAAAPEIARERWSRGRRPWRWAPQRRASEAEGGPWPRRRWPRSNRTGSTTGWPAGGTSSRTPWWGTGSLLDSRPATKKEIVFFAKYAFLVFYAPSCTAKHALVCYGESSELRLLKGSN